MAGGAGAVRRWRERRLRSWLLHERQTVAMELAAALHHSRDARSNVVHEAPRGQKTASSWTQPEPLVEVSEPQVGSSHRRLRGCPGPFLVVASLAGGDEVDATTVSFLLRENLMLQKIKEEEKERRRVLEEKEEEEFGQARPGVPLSAAEAAAWSRWWTRNIAPILLVFFWAEEEAEEEEEEKAPEGQVPTLSSRLWTSL